MLLPAAGELGIGRRIRITTVHGADDEEIVQKCLEVIRQEKKASTSLLQRRLRLGYTRAARMMDILEQRGIIGPGEGAKPREILINVGQDEA